MTLRKQVIHDCQPPEVADPESRHQWKCDGCGAWWHWTAAREWTEPEWYGFLHLKHREVTFRQGGNWYARHEDRAQWVEVDA